MPTDPTLAALRDAAFAQLASETGHGLWTWRAIITDSESPTGVALACTSGSNLHIIPDHPGGPIRDEDGVYDCCPDIQFDTYSVSLAAYLVGLLNADAACIAKACLGCDSPARAGSPWCSQRCRNFDDQHDANDTATGGDTDA